MKPTSSDIKRRLFANPIFWVDKECALARALADGTVPEGDINRSTVEAELTEARGKVRGFLANGAITQADVDAEKAAQGE